MDHPQPIPVARGLRARLQRIFGAPQDLCACQLPARIGMLADAMLRLFFSGLRIENDQVERLRDLPREAIIIYAIKHRSTFEFLFSHTRYGKLGIPIPELDLDQRTWAWQPLGRMFRIVFAAAAHLLRHGHLPDGFETGQIERRLLDGHAGMLSLFGDNAFYRRFVKAKTDPIQQLIRLQKRMDRPVIIIPQLMFFGRNPQRPTLGLRDILLGTEERPGWLRRTVTLFRHPGKVFVELSEPVNVQDFLSYEDRWGQSEEYQSLLLRRRLLTLIDRHRQSITGPSLKSHEELKESILTSERVNEFIDHYAAKREEPIYAVRKEADGYLDEIAARYNIRAINVLRLIVGRVLDMMFEGVSIDMNGLARIKEAAKRGPLILIPCHKSHIDYLILSYVLFENHMPAPHIAAGKNLSFWPMGPIFRSGGAFFLRRSFKGAVLYSRIFAEYIHYLLAEGFNIEFFIEGGRSRTGKMILPKLGLLSILINAYKHGACEDMIFVPIYIGYDRVLEEGAYLAELEGAAKKPESLMQVIKARKFLKSRYGRIYINFHEPLSFANLLRQMNIDLETLPQKEQNALCRNLGHRVINAVNHVAVITPHAIVAAALLNIERKRFSIEDLNFTTDAYLSHLTNLNAPLADTLVVDSAGAMRQALESYRQRKFVERISLGRDEDISDDVYVINENKRPNLEFYKNTGIALFVPAAFTALAILDQDAFQFAAGDLHADYRFLQELFKNEFAYDIDRSVEHYVRKTLKAFIDDAILMPHPQLPDTYNLTAIGLRKLKSFGRFLRAYFESYWIVLSHFTLHGEKEMDLKERLRKIASTGQRMYRREEIELKESLSRINYSNAAEFFISRGLEGPNAGEAIERFEKALERYLKRLRG
jgi:glycerol-3-phosphate O-acyltransferase